MNFQQFKKLQQEHFARMIDGQNALFAVDLEKNDLWQTYLDSFPTGANNIYRERREFDCSCCKQFIRAFGNVATIANNKLLTIWDFEPNDDTFSSVTSALSKTVKQAAVRDVFVTKESAFGTDKNHELLDNGGVHTWHHFRLNLPRRLIHNSSKSASVIAAQYRDTKNVFQRSLEEISNESVQTVIDLIAEKMIYRGDEWEPTLKQFLELHNEYHALPENERDNWCWLKAVEVGGAVGRIRNHSIGTLLQDLTGGMELEKSLRRYESVMAPTNYKRPKGVFTAKMVEQAQKAANDLGLLDSLPRRFATIGDITINNVLWANRDAVKKMGNAVGVFDMLKSDVTVDPKKFKNVPSVTIDSFIANILPNLSTLDLLLENRHEPNFVSLIAPQNKEAPSMFKWSNGFSWAYNGNVADSMKQRVKAAGGKVDGVLRLSLQWNTEGDNLNDYDAHCTEPSGNHISYQSTFSPRTGGNLDVDMRNFPASKVAVENITWPQLSRIDEGVYEFSVHNYDHLGGESGFDAEIEYAGQVYEFTYHKNLRHNERVTVARFSLSKPSGISFIESLPLTTSTKNVWGIKTNQWQPVSSVMYSPNYWDSQSGIGNRHFIFMLAGCVNNNQPNGFFNEYLHESLMEHRQVFEALGSKMKVEPNENQLSGLGFSSTQRNSVICKTDNGIIKVVF